MKKQHILEEEITLKSFDKGQFKRMISFVKPVWKSVAISLVLIIISSLLALASPMLMQKAIDGPINNMIDDVKNEKIEQGVPEDQMDVLTGNHQPKHDNVVLLSVLMIALFAASALNILMGRWKTLIMTKAAQKMLGNMRLELFKNLQRLSFSYYDSHPTGKILSRITSDVQSIANVLTNGLVSNFVNLFSLIAVIIIMFSIQPMMTLIALALAPLFAIWSFAMRKTLKEKYTHLVKQDAVFNGFIHEQVTGMSIVQSFCCEDVMYDDCEKASENLRHAAWKQTEVSDIFRIVTKLFDAIATVSIYIFGVQFIDAGYITVGIMIAFVSYIGMLWGPIVSFMDFYNTFMSTIASAERVFELMDMEPDIKDKQDALECNIKGDVEFRNVSFTYEEGQKNVLNNINFDVKAGQTIALVGPTGAGKSTIVNLISRFYDVKEGEVLIDGVDVRDYKQSSLRKQMGVMLQDPFLFSGTIMENIRYGRLEATDEECINAAKIVFAHEFIMNLHDGYGTVVHERGVGISQGQRQLIAFARAVLCDPKILILDEATSSIDTQTEVILQRAINKMLEGRTSFVIAHRLSTIKNADKIMVVAENSIFEEGTHEELMQKNGMYASLQRAQYTTVNLA